MAKRISALHGHYSHGTFGASGEVGVVLCEVADLRLQQVAAWHDTLGEVGRRAAQVVGVPEAPQRGASVINAKSGSALLRVEPLKWWIFGGEVLSLPPELGATLDISHSRTHVRISGVHATTLLNRHLGLDLREASFAEGAVASSVFQHVGVTLWRTPQGYELFIPRGFALSVWEVLLQSAAQFGGEVS